MKQLISHLYLRTQRWLYQSSYSFGNVLGINQGNRLILCYHNVGYDNDPYTITPERFRAQIHRIKDYAEIVDLKTLLGQSHPDSNLVALTFDDGYHGVSEYALPILKEFEVTATAFILAQPLLANRDELGNMIPLMRTPQIKELIKAGWRIGCHSQTHPDFTALSHSQMVDEIATAKKILELKLETPIDYFAYPKAKADAAVQKVVGLAGYKAGLGVSPNTLVLGANRWQLPRLIIDRAIQAEEFPAYIARSVLNLRQITDYLQLGRLRWL